MVTFGNQSTISGKMVTTTIKKSLIAKKKERLWGQACNIAIFSCGEKIRFEISFKVEVRKSPGVIHKKVGVEGSAAFISILMGRVWHRRNIKLFRVNSN
jgi:hypothetical protein